MASIKKTTNKDGRTVYRVRIRHKNQPTQTSTFSKLADAKKWVHTTETSVLEGRHFPIAEAKRHTVAELLDRYTNEIMPRKRSSTVYSEKYRLRWWHEQLGSQSLADITPAIIIEQRDKLARNHAGSTVNRYLAVFGHALSIAVREWQWLDDNPMRRVSKLQEPRGRVRFLSDDERERLLAACKKSRNPHLYIVVVLALSTGARRGELLNLTWQNIDLQRRIILLEDTKNGERRVLPLAGHALDLMRELANHRRIDTEWVFPGPTGDKPMRIREAWEYAVKRAKLENQDVVFHTLRHSAASYFLMNGASLGEIGEILGHRNYETTRKYAHQSESHTRGVVECMNEKIFDKLT